MGFTKAELEEMRRADAEIEETFCLTAADFAFSDELDAQVTRETEVDLNHKQVYYRENKEVVRQRSREYHWKNHDKVMERKRRYYDENKKQMVEANRVWQEKNCAKYADDQSRIRTARKKRGWSQEFLADKLGVRPVTIWKWETGRLKVNWLRIFEVLPELATEEHFENR